MNRRMLTQAEIKQMKAVIHALERGRQDCSSEEKKLVNRFVMTTKIRLAEDKDLQDEAFFRAIQQHAIGKEY